MDSEYEEDEKSFRAEAEKEKLRTGSVDLNKILDSIHPLAPSVVMLQVQADCKRLPTTRRSREATALRRQPTQAVPAGTM